MTLRRLGAAILRRAGGRLPDKTYLKLMFRLQMGQKLDFGAPETFNAKLQWLKVYDRRPEYTGLVDKIEVKKRVAELIGAEHIIPTLAEWDTPEAVNLDGLPDSFVLKCNHYGGNQGVFIVRDKAGFDLADARVKLRKVLKQSIYRNCREWPYRDVRPRIFAEELIGTDIEDYKFFCYDGFVESVMVCCERSSGETKFYFFDRDWKLKRYNKRGLAAPEGFTIPRPEGLERMFEMASTLSKGIPFVRVDLYNIEGRIYFGEMTFFPDSGMDPNLLPQTDAFFGSLINLPDTHEKQN